jgi:hypothetical protein
MKFLIFPTLLYSRSLAYEIFMGQTLCDFWQIWPNIGAELNKLVTGLCKLLFFAQFLFIS